MENKENNNHKKNQDNYEAQPKKSWIERNLWWIAVGLAIFFLRMCNDLSR